MNGRTCLAPGRRAVAGLALALVLAAGCGSSGDDGDDSVGTDSGDAPPAETSSGDGGGSECRTEIVEDEYGFEVEIEVCD